MHVCSSRCFVDISSPNHSSGILGHQCASALHCLLGLRNVDSFFPRRPQGLLCSCNRAGGPTLSDSASVSGGQWERESLQFLSVGIPGCWRKERCCQSDSGRDVCYFHLFFTTNLHSFSPFVGIRSSARLQRGISTEIPGM